MSRSKVSSSLVEISSNFEDKLYVGYGKVSIDPNINGKPIPLAGYGNTHFRVATFGKNDQKYQQNLYATAIAIKDENGNIVILVTLDLISLNVQTTTNIRNAVAKETDIPAERIVLSCTHTHSAPDTNFTNSNYPELVDSINSYKNLLAKNITTACKETLNDLKKAEIYVGTTDIVREDGANALNFVRHYETNAVYKNGDKVVSGDNHGVYSWNGTKWEYHSRIAHTTKADSVMQIIKFKFEKAKDILMINWQTHPHITGSSTSTTISADFIAPFRDAIEKEKDCRVAYYTGASANINWKTLIADGSEGIKGITHQNSSSTSEQKYNLSIKYGKRLSKYVLDIYNNLGKIEGKYVKNKQEKYLINRITKNDIDDVLLVNANFCKKNLEF